jgi:hypothetical protein
MSKSDIKQAVELFESFREKKPKRIKRIVLDVPRAVALIGKVDFIGYTTTHGKKIKRYQHDFAAGSRPTLCISADGLQILLIGGRFRFDERGIVDKDEAGGDIINPEHGKDI